MATVIPVLRTFDYAKTIEFYVDWLGAKIIWEHIPKDGPFYLQLELQGAKINLSQHHGECSPGALVLVDGCEDLEAYHQQLQDKGYRFMNPGLERQEWDTATLSMTVIDPFYNRIQFNEKTE